MWPADNVYSFFEGTAGKSPLRNLAWIQGNRRKVAYIYMTDSAFGGLTNFNRYFFAQGSGGDTMAWYFTREGVVKLVGKRTRGGLVTSRIPAW